MTAPINQTFVSGTTISSEWLNGVNDFVNISKNTTANRPTNPFIGLLFFDTTLNKPIWHNGTNWVDSSGTIV